MDNLSLREQMNQRTVKQLREVARERNIRQYTKMRKDVLIEALLKSKEAAQNVDEDKSGRVPKPKPRRIKEDRPLPPKKRIS